MYSIIVVGLNWAQLPGKYTSCSILLVQKWPLMQEYALVHFYIPWSCKDGARAIWPLKFETYGNIEHTSGVMY